MIAGNFEDKYNTKNPISRYLVSNFTNRFKILLKKVKTPKKIVEVGVGEGYLTKIIAEQFAQSRIFASDISKSVLRKAQKTLKGHKVHFSVEDLEKLGYPDRKFDLVVCCEVLEHVNKPKEALDELRRIAKDNVILSVPSEPVWRILNVIRLKYLDQLGNTPGHVNHWSIGEFEKLVGDSGFKIISRVFPFPWQMYLLKKK